MATTYTFGSQVNQASFLELDPVSVPTTTAGVNVLVAPRPPAASITLQVKNAATLADLDPVTVGENGYWSYTTVDVPIILVSGDSGASWSPHYAREALDAAIGTGASVTFLGDRVTVLEDVDTDLATRLSNLENALANGGGTSGTGGYAGAPAGSIFAWPPPDKPGQLLPRPSTRLDIAFVWELPDPPPSGGGYSLPAVDRFTDTSP